MTRNWLSPVLALVAAAPSVALAQTAPPAGNIDDRTRQQLRTPTEREREDALMTGNTDILLLRRTRLFNLTGSVDVTGTSNSALAPTAERPDSFAQGQVGIAIGTRIGGKVDIFASANLVGVRYFRESQLDYSAFSGSVGASTSIGRVNLSAVYAPSIVLTRDFSRRQLTSHRFRAQAALPFRIRGATIQPELHAERAITHPGDYSAWSGGGSVSLSGPISKRLPLLAFASVGYDRRSFDNYFEAFVGTKRLDDGLSASVGILWRPRAWGEVRASYSYGRNWSTSDVNGYTAHSGTLGVSAVLRF